MRRYAKVEIIASSVEYHYFQRFNRTRAGFGRQGAGFPTNKDEVFIKVST